MWLRIFESLHGHLGVLAAASLFHPAVLLRKGQQLSRGSKLAVILATLFAVSAFGGGVFIYEDYRQLVKRNLFRASTQAGFFFETKEHLAYGVVALALGAAVCALLAPKEARHLRKASAAAYFTAAVLATGVCLLGTYVAAIQGFPEGK